ncbi:MAG: ferredoxin [Myxococcota bacterium]
MKIEVDFDLCEANGVCEDHAPEVFHIDDEDMLHLREEAIHEGLRESIESAVKFCPRGALTLVEG